MSEGVRRDRSSSTQSRPQLRARLIEVAAQLLATGGREAVSIRAVAAAAGTQAPTIYRLFGDKAGLLSAVAEHGYVAYLETKPPRKITAEPVQELRTGWDAHIEFGLANPALFTLMYGDPDPDQRRGSSTPGSTRSPPRDASAWMSSSPSTWSTRQAAERCWPCWPTPLSVEIPVSPTRSLKR